MTMPNWLEVLGSDVIGGIITAVGVHFYEKYHRDVEVPADPKAKRRAAAEGITRHFLKTSETDRIEMAEDLRRFVGPNCRIMQLLEQMNILGGAPRLEETGRRYRENWVANLLTLIPREQRAVVYPRLEALLHNENARVGVAQFFARLAVYDDDGFVQILKIIGESVRETFNYSYMSEGGLNDKKRQIDIMRMRCGMRPKYGTPELTFWQKLDNLFRF